MARRRGTDPPPLSQIQDQGEREERQLKTGPTRNKTNIPKSKQIQKAQPAKKKRRLNRQQVESKTLSTTNPKRNPKRPRHAVSGRDLSDRPGHPTLKNWVVREEAEPTMDEPAKEPKQGVRVIDERDSTIPQITLRSEPQSQFGQASDTVRGSPTDGAHNKATEQGLRQQYRGETTEKPPDTLTDQIKQAKRARPKKRQRTISEFAGTRSQDNHNDVQFNQEGDKGETETMGHHKHKRTRWPGEEPGPPQQAIMEAAR